MVKIRLTRCGRRNRPYYRVVVCDSRVKRDGKYIENVGTYDPLERNPEKAVFLKSQRIQYWLSVGAQPTQTVWTLLRKHGVIGQRKSAGKTGEGQEIPQGSDVAETTGVGEIEK